MPPDRLSEDVHLESVRKMAEAYVQPRSRFDAECLAYEVFAGVEHILTRWEWPAVRAITDALLRYRHLTPHELHDLYVRALGRESRSPVIECEGHNGQPCDRPAWMAVA
jgi:hypothetical protein